MSQTNRDKMHATVQQMFSLVAKTGDSHGLDADGVPMRLKTMAETIFSDDVVMTIPGRGPHAFSGGRDAYYRYNKELAGTTERKLNLKLLDIIVGESHAAGVILYSDERDGETFSWRRINLYRFNDTFDKIVEVRVFEHDQYGVDDWYSRSITGDWNAAKQAS